MQNLTEKIDELFAQNRGKEAEALLEESLRVVMKEGRWNEAIPILNELIGYCRETSQVEKSYEYAEKVLFILEQHKMQGTIPYATTLLNIANAYRAGGRLEDSLKAYDMVREIYQRNLKENDMLFASLYNNISLLYQEMGRFDLAKESLLQALAIVEIQENTAFEVAVTYTNLAATELSLGQDEEAVKYFTRAIELFEENHIEDTHYCAALSSLGTYHYKKGDFRQAEEFFIKAMYGIEKHLGKNEYYQRMKENAEVCRQSYEQASIQKGLDICRMYYETYGKPMLERVFPEYLNRIAVGLVGEGSDCFGYDDEISRDHDWGPGFCMWISEETYEQIGCRLQEAYDALPKEFMGFTFRESVQGKNRRGVATITQFYKKLLGEVNFPDSNSYVVSGDDTDNRKEWEKEKIHGDRLISLIKWEELEDYALAAAVNGQVFTDPEGIFSEIRYVLQKKYPVRLRYLKLAQSVAAFCQNGQYNVPRVLLRGDRMTAGILLSESVKEAMKLLYYIDGEYPPHDKWLIHGLKQRGKYREILCLLEKVILEGVKQTGGDQEGNLVEKIAQKLVQLLYQKHFISDITGYLDFHTPELLYKAGIADLDIPELADRIARMEFQAFDKVKNLGGRADCQDDWFTFSIMRKSQYLTWNKSMLLQYAYDFTREYEQGHNLIEEKYGRMMESTAPEEYAVIWDRFPVISPQKKAIIEAIVEMQVKWMEEFAAEYPYLAGNARSIHTYEDRPWNTSYETYLRGEISTYSDKMLQLYGQYVVEHSRSGRNPAERIMEHSVLMYGYENLESAEKGLRESQ